MKYYDYNTQDEDISEVDKCIIMIAPHLRNTRSILQTKKLNRLIKKKKKKKKTETINTVRKNTLKHRASSEFTEIIWKSKKGKKKAKVDCLNEIKNARDRETHN